MGSPATGAPDSLETNPKLTRGAGVGFGLFCPGILAVLTAKAIARNSMRVFMGQLLTSKVRSNFGCGLIHWFKKGDGEL
jgi:hypothetical protein